MYLVFIPEEIYCLIFAAAEVDWHSSQTLLVGTPALYILIKNADHYWQSLCYLSI